MNELVITRVFDAPIHVVWDAFSRREQLMRWWGPKGFTTPTCKMDFRIGGKYHYDMRSPDGKDFWGTGTYQEIVPLKRIVCSDSFSDEKGNVVSPVDYGMPANVPSEMKIVMEFEVQDGRTRYTLHHLGIPEGEFRDQCRAGWSESFDKLDALLKESSGGQRKTA